MKKYFTLLLINTCAATTILAQPKFNYARDYNRILAQSKNPNSKLYYDRLLGRFRADDSTLTNPEVLALMIGFTSRPEYKLNSRYDYKGQAMYLLAEDGKYSEACDTGASGLKDEPLDYVMMYDMAELLRKIGKPDSAQYYERMKAKIFKAMEYSGDGESPQTAIFKIDDTGEWGFFMYKGYQPLRDDSLVRYHGIYYELCRANKDGKQIQEYFAMHHIMQKHYNGSVDKAIRAIGYLNKNELEVDYHGPHYGYEPVSYFDPSRITSVYVRTRNSSQPVNIKIKSFKISFVHKGHVMFSLKCNSGVFDSQQRAELKKAEGPMRAGDKVIINKIKFVDRKIRVKNKFISETIF